MQYCFVFAVYHLARFPLHLHLNELKKDLLVLVFFEQSIFSKAAVIIVHNRQLPIMTR